MEITQSIFDIETYLSRYKCQSNVSLQRLLHLSRTTHDKEASKHWFQLLEQRLKANGNTKMYREVFDNATASPQEENGAGTSMEVDGVVAEETSGGGVVISGSTNHQQNTPSNVNVDLQYIQGIEMNASIQLKTLEENLANSQSNLTKDSIRNSYLSLAKFHRSRGMIDDAIRFYQRAKEFCSSSNSEGIASDINLSLAECGLESQNVVYDKMVENLSGLTDSNPNDMIYASKMKCARGIAYLKQGKYQLAAMSFLSIKQVEFTNQFNSVLSTEDISLYGGLLGLITLDRSAIKSILEIEAWRERLDLLPSLQQAIRCYMKAEYGKCLQLIQSIRDVVEIDKFLYPHIDTLWKMMREKCIVQYFQPYSSVSLINIKHSFGFDDVDEVEDIVASLIDSNRIVGARIDGVNRTLTSMSVKGLEQRKRQMMMRKVGMMGDRLIDEVEGMILRVSCLENDIVVVDENKANRRGRSSGHPMPSPYRHDVSSDEEAYDLEI